MLLFYQVVLVFGMFGLGGRLIERLAGGAGDIRILQSFVILFLEHQQCYYSIRLSWSSDWAAA
jgi:hypothetical protein